MLLLALAPTLAAAADWFPVVAMVDGRKANYVPLAKVSRPWRVCALIPNGVDKFWWGVGWGLNEDARHFNLKLGVYNAGGYDQLEAQRAQFNTCRARKADAILLATVTPDGLKQEIASAMADGVVVVDMINRVAGAETTAHSAADAAQLGKLAGNYLLESAAGRSVAVTWLPGPKDADWVAAAERGVLPALNRPTVKLTHGGHGLPDVGQQMGLVRAAMAGPPPDYILANAPAAEAAARFLSNMTPPNAQATQVIAYYASEPVFNFIKERKLLAAASNSPVLQAHIALDLALRALERTAFAKDVQVIPEMIDIHNIGDYDTRKLFAPPNTWIGLHDLPD